LNGSTPIDERYFEWLYLLVSSSNTRPNARYVKLCELLYTIPFSWTVQKDGNRVEDAREIRQDFLNANRSEYRPDIWVDMDASVLEIIMGVSQRLAFKTDESPGVCFWKLIHNLGLDEYHDRNWSHASRHNVEQVVKRFINRTYHPNGHGGLFPLNDPQEDQRDIEIWNQLNAYLWERMPYR